MPNQKLKNFIKNQLDRGVSKEKIKEALFEKGWEEERVEEAFSNIESNKESFSLDSEQNEQEIKSKKELPKVGKVLKNAFNLFKKRKWTLIGISATPILLASFFITLFLFSFFRIHPSFNLGVVLFSFGFLILAFFSLWSLVALLISLFEETKYLNSFKQSINKILPYLLVSFFMIMAVAFGLILFLIPGIIFSIWFMFARFVLIDEDIRGTKALLRSKKYVEGRWFYVLKHLVSISLLSILVPLIFAPIFLVLNFVLSLINPIFSSLVNFVAQTLVRASISAFVLTYLFVLYKKLKNSKSSEELKSTSKEKITFNIGKIIVIIFSVLLIIIMVSYFVSFARDAIDYSNFFETDQGNIEEGVGETTESSSYDLAVQIRDEARISHIRQISIAMEMDYDEDEAYISQSSMPNQIGDYMNEVPKDPKTDESYNWIDNTKNDQKYCVYTKLETEDKYFVTSNKGLKEVEEEPTTLECW